jgi:hypothetical protein
LSPRRSEFRLTQRRRRGMFFTERRTPMPTTGFRKMLARAAEGAEFPYPRQKAGMIPCVPFQNLICLRKIMILGAFGSTRFLRWMKFEKKQFRNRGLGNIDAELGQLRCPISSTRRADFRILPVVKLAFLNDDLILFVNRTPHAVTDDAIGLLELPDNPVLATRRPARLYGRPQPN